MSKLYKFNDATSFLKLIKNPNTKSNRLMTGFIEDNKGSTLTEEQAKGAWLMAHIKHYPGFKGFTNVNGTVGRGFGMNVPWVAKRCDSIVVFRA